MAEHTVFCVKLKKELPGLDEPPFDTELGKKVYENVSRDAWHSWMDQNNMGWAAWKLDDCDYELATSGVADTSCILKLNAPKTGGWTPAYLQGHGPYVVDKLKN